MAEQLSMFDTTQSKTTTKVVNVASVPQRSPFRYPGGKTWLIPVVRKWLKQSSRKALGEKLLIEPFAGGGIVSLNTAFENLADKIVMVKMERESSLVGIQKPCEIGLLRLVMLSQK